MEENYDKMCISPPGFFMMLGKNPLEEIKRHLKDCESCREDFDRAFEDYYGDLEVGEPLEEWRTAGLETIVEPEELI